MCYCTIDDRTVNVRPADLSEDLRVVDGEVEVRIEPALEETHLTLTMSHNAEDG